MWSTSATLQDCQFTSAGTEASTTEAAKEYDPSGVEQVNIDELVELAEGNIMAADQYKGKWVTADGVVASVDEDKIIVAGPVHAESLAMFGMLGDSLQGFTCVYTLSLIHI